MSDKIPIYAIRLIGPAGSVIVNDELPPAGSLLASYDPDGNAGAGDASWTLDPSRALVFNSPGAALELWRRRSTVRPLRPDGRPNRPLTAYTIEVSPLERNE